MVYSVEVAARAEKDIRALPVRAQARVLRALDRLRTNPRTAPGVKKLAAEELYRLRVGPYRVLFAIEK